MKVNVTISGILEARRRLEAIKIWNDTHTDSALIPDPEVCPRCSSSNVIGITAPPAVEFFQCQDCGKEYDDLVAEVTRRIRRHNPFMP